jgi:serine/threonine protein kinase
MEKQGDSELRPEVARIGSFFTKESNFLRNTKHPAIPIFFKTASNQDGYYLVEEHLEGGFLRNIIEKEGPLSESAAMDLVWDIADLLVYLQENKQALILGNLNPATVFVTNKEINLSEGYISKQELEGKTKIIDFSRVISLKSAQNETPNVLSENTGYSPKDSILDLTFDIYSFGAVLFYILTGRNPNEFNDVIPSPQKLNPNISEIMDSLVRDCMNPDKNERIPNARELKRRLETAGRILYVDSFPRNLNDFTDEDPAATSNKSGSFSFLGKFFDNISSFNVFIFLIVIGAILMFFRGETMPLFNECTFNLKEIGADVQRYAYDNQGLYPDSLSQLNPKYMQNIPSCPAAGKDTYTVSYEVSIDHKFFTIYCSGLNHKMIVYKENYPKFNPKDGLIRYPGEWKFKEEENKEQN